MNNYSDLNHLPTEVKTLIVNGQALVDEAKEVLEKKGCNFDLTSKRELKADIKRVEKTISLIGKGKNTEKMIKELDNSIILLRTVLTGVENFFR